MIKTATLRRMATISGKFAALAAGDVRVVMTPGYFSLRDGPGTIDIYSAGIDGNVTTSLKTFRASLKGLKGDVAVADGTIAGFPVPCDGMECSRVRAAETPETAVLVMTGEDLHSALHDVAFCMSKEEARYYLNGVFFTQNPDGMLRLVATDGHRLAMRDTETAVADAPASWPGDGPIVQDRTIHALIALLAAFPADEVRIAVQTFESDEYGAQPVNRVTFTTRDWTVTAKLIDGCFPDYTRVIPTDNDTAVSVDLAAIAPDVARAAAVEMATGAYDATAAFCNESPRVGTTAVESLRWDCPVTMGIPHYRFADLAKSMPQAVIHLKAHGEVASYPYVVTCDAKPALRVVEMPVRASAIPS